MQVDADHPLPVLDVHVPYGLSARRYAGVGDHDVELAERGKGLADQIAGLEGNERVEAELADLKSKVGQGKPAAGKGSE